MPRIFASFFAFAWALSSTLGFAQGTQNAEAPTSSVRTPRVKATLMSSHTQVRAGQKFHVGLRFEMIPEWHIYWKNPGDSGEAPKFKWTAAPEVTMEETLWPTPERISMSVLANYGYEHDILIPTPIEIQSNAQGNFLELEADWLVCKEECIPESGRFRIKLPTVGLESISSVHVERFEVALALVPGKIDIRGATHSVSSERRVLVQIPIAELGIDQEDFELELFPTTEGVFEAGEDTLTQHDNHFLRFEYLLAPQTLTVPTKLGFVLSAKPLERTSEQPRVSVEFATLEVGNAASNSTSSIWLALLGAFLGGLLLNLMPCVLPVLSLKAFSVLKSRENLSSLRKDGLSYAVGILVSFWLLAGLLLLLRASGEALGWGFQLQNPVFVLFMTWLFVVLSLNFFGVFEMGESLQAWSGRLDTNASQGLHASFLSGVLATLIATPCTAPFMGSALGLALALPAWQALLIFTALGVGMALPIVLINFYPASLKFLPRPGAWMESFKQFMGLPMLATACWLLWVYGLQTNIDSVARFLFSCLALAAALWTLGRFARSPKKLIAVFVFLLLFAWLAWPLVMSNRGEPRTGGASPLKSDYSGLGAEDYSRTRLNELLLEEKRPVYVDFTAAWCLTCQVNKRIVFPDAEIQALFREKNIAILKGDWTDKNPTLLKELEAFGRSGVPLNLYYDPASPNEAHVFPAILRPSAVADAIRQRTP